MGTWRKMSAHQRMELVKATMPTMADPNRAWGVSGSDIEDGGMSELKHWEHDDPAMHNDHNPGILFSRIVAIHRLPDGRIRMEDNCDGYYYEEMPKEEAIEMLQEAIDWIKQE